MKAVVQMTGEVLELNPTTLAELQTAWQQCSEYEKAYKSLKDQMKPLVENYVGAYGTSEPVNGYQFRVSTVQRYNYDKAVLRQNLDEDTVDLLLVPDKRAVDEYLKANLADLGGASTTIRDNMIPVGRPYTVIKAEKIERSE